MSGDKPLVSVVTPSYKQAQFIEENILSIKNQDYPNIEHIIMDGGSTDGTVDILKRYDNILTWVSEPDKGQSDAINKGFKMAKGEIIGWLNSDDAYTIPNAISTAVEALNRHPDIDLIYGHCLEINEKGDVTDMGKSPEFSHYRLFNYLDFIPQPTVFFRRTLFDKVGYLDESLHYGMDYDFWLRIGKVSNMMLVPKVMAEFRYSPHSKSGSQEKEFWPEIRQIYRRHNGRLLSPFWYSCINELYLIRMKRVIKLPFIKLRDLIFKFE